MLPCNSAKGTKPLGYVEQELEFARSRNLKNLEEGQNLLNRMKGRPACTLKSLLRMRSHYSMHQAALGNPSERLRSLLAEDQFVYVWNYSLVLLSNLSLQFRLGHEPARADAFEKPLETAARARKLYVQGKLDEAAVLVARLVNDLTGHGPLERR